MRCVATFRVFRLLNQKKSPSLRACLLERAHIPDLIKHAAHPASNSVFVKFFTLGDRNHFIELCIGQNDDVWIMLHSGSRGIGNAIGQYFINLAKKDMQQNVHNLPDKDLAYFTEGAQHFDDYVEAMHWA